MTACSTCDGTGLVAPDPFGHPEPWHRYVASVAEHCRKRGMPEWVSSLITPQPCPGCSSRPAGSPGTGAARAVPVPGHDDEAFALGVPESGRASKR